MGLAEIALPHLLLAIGKVDVPWFLRERKEILVNFSGTVEDHYGDVISEDRAAEVFHGLKKFIPYGGSYESLLYEVGLSFSKDHVVASSNNNVVLPQISEFWLKLAVFEVAAFLFRKSSDRGTLSEIGTFLNTCEAFGKPGQFGNVYVRRVLKYGVAVGVLEVAGKNGASDYSELYELAYPAGMRLAHSRRYAVLSVLHRLMPFMSLYYDVPVLSVAHKALLAMWTIIAIVASTARALLGLLFVQIALGLVVGLMFAAVAGFAANVGASYYWNELCPELESLDLPLRCAEHKAK